MNTILNHLNLSASDVPTLAAFFRNVFSFRTVTERAGGDLTVLEREGFILTLMRNRMLDGPTYPSTFHVGFLQSTRNEVQDLLTRIRAFGLEAKDPTPMSGARFGFYVNIPGSIVVEISTTAA